MTDVELEQQVRTSLDGASRDACARVCALLGLDSGGTKGALQSRALSALSGPAERRRRNWLALAVRVGVLGELDLDADLDDESIDGSSANVTGAELLQDLNDRLSNSVGLDRFLPFSLLPDIQRDFDDSNDEDGIPTWEFSLPEQWIWFSRSDLSHLLGSGNSGQLEQLQQQMEELQRQNTAMPKQVKSQLAADIAENRFATVGDQSVGTLHKTLAFDMPEDFFMYSHVVNDDGSPDLLLEKPSRDDFRTILFDSKLSSKDILRIERHTMVPMDYWLQAPKFDAKQ